MAEESQEEQRERGIEMSKRSIEASLKAVRGDVFYLPEYVEGWGPEADENAEIAFRMEWESEMNGHLRLLERAHVGGEMTTEQERSYQDLKNLIKERMPTAG